MILNIFALFPLLISLLWTGCGTSDRTSFSASDQTYVTTQKPTSLSVSGETSPSDTNSSSENNTVSIQSTIHMKPGERLPLYLTVTYPDGHTKKVLDEVTFSSQDPAVASIYANGTIIAHKEGKTQIYARYHDLAAMLEVVVTAEAKPLPLALEIVNYQKNAETGEQIPLHARLTYDDNRSQDLTDGVIWQSDTPSLCSVTESGVVTALAVGECLVTAIYQHYEANTTLHITSPETKVPYTCPATLQSEENFTDLFSTQQYDDINYSSRIIFEKPTVKEIEALFNQARAVDPTVNEPMVLPPQKIWDLFDASEKVLYLVNAERCARGIKPLEGIDDRLERNVTTPYADFIATHEELFLSHPHTADGKTPGERMEDANITLGTTSQYWGENVAMIGISHTNAAQPIFESEAKAVYAWLYMDRSESYGHRQTILHTGFNDDSGESGKEGLLAAATAQKEYQDAQGAYWTKAFTVMDLFDPTPQWDEDLSHVHSVSLYRRDR